MGVPAGCGEVGDGETLTAVNGVAVMIYQSTMFTSVPLTPSFAVTESR